MARAGGIRDEVGLARTIAGAIAADSATLTDANFPTSGALNCYGFDTLFVGVEIDGGASPTGTIEALFRDAEAADGSRWHRRLFGARDGITAVGAPASETTGAIASNASMVELKVHGHPQVFLRVTAVTNSAGTTAMRILVAPGKKRG